VRVSGTVVEGSEERRAQENHLVFSDRETESRGAEVAIRLRRAPARQLPTAAALGDRRRGPCRQRGTVQAEALLLKRPSRYEEEPDEVFAEGQPSEETMMKAGLARWRRGGRAGAPAAAPGPRCRRRRCLHERAGVGRSVGRSVDPAVAATATRKSPSDAAEVTVPTSLPLAISGPRPLPGELRTLSWRTRVGQRTGVGQSARPSHRLCRPKGGLGTSPGMLFHTTKFGRLEKLMPLGQTGSQTPKSGNTVALAWSLHTKASETTAGGLSTTTNVPAATASAGRDGPEAVGSLPISPISAIPSLSARLDWQQGWQKAHNESGAEWSQAEREACSNTCAPSAMSPWGEAYRPGERSNSRRGAPDRQRAAADRRSRRTAPGLSGL
jgi:hypothetical protein